MKVSTHLHLLPELRMSGEEPSFPHTSSWGALRKIYFPRTRSCVNSAWCLSPNCHTNVVFYIKACSHNMTVNVCGRKLKLCVIHFLLLQGGINEIGGETKATNQQNRQKAKASMFVWECSDCRV